MWSENDVMIEAVIFDFDGVIMDSEPIHYQAYCQVLKSIGQTLTYDEYIAKYLGLSDKQMLPKFLFDREQSYSSKEINQLIQRKVETYTNIITKSKQLPMIPNVDHCLEVISQRIKKIAICSGSAKREVSAALHGLKEGKLKHYFDTITTAEDVNLGKPSPEGYLLTVDKLELLPKNCLVIEDSPHGIEAAREAGMNVIALCSSYNEEKLYRANKVITSFKHLLEEDFLSS